MLISSKRALAAIVFLALGAGGALARHACHNDAFRFCRHAIPNRRLIHDCLERNLPHLTRACRAEIR
jgi:hypothetical protein